MRILIIESSGLIAERLINLVEETSTGVNFYHCISLKEAKEFLRPNQPDMMLLDLKVARHTAIELICKIKEKNSKAVVICMYMMPDDSFHAECLKNGADHIIDKYLEFEKIPLIVSSVIKAAGTN